MSRRAAEVARWLGEQPSLSEVAQAYPEEWDRVQRDVERLVAAGDAGSVTDYLTRTARGPQARPGHRRAEREEISEQIRRYLTVRAVDQAHLRATTGVRGDRLRMPLVSGFVTQRLLFRRGLERRPVSLAAYRMVWPLLRGRRRLMPLVRRRGIYCFYSRPLIDRLVGLIGERPCLEIGAGDGTLARFLAERGVDVTATDDRTWSSVIDYPASVQALSAGKALRRLRPTVVLCSWPPPGNTFERQVFATASVQTYIVVTTREEAAAGDWAAYRSQRDFDLVDDARLGRLVLPRELDGAVLVFTRRPG